jgi:predicted O-methyltransferase YrrM
MHHSEFIGILASIYKPNTYVELGLYEGETFKYIIPHSKKLYGIDLKSNIYLEALKKYSNVEIQYTTTDNFFENFNVGIDMAFIDADHCFESALKDFDNIFKRLNPGGIIILHDTDPDNDSLINPLRCGDSYRIVELLEKRDDINIITLPLESPGLSIVTKKNDTRVYRRHN